MKVWMPVLTLFLLWTGAVAQTAYQLESGEMTIAGTSTIHDWESTVNEVKIEGNFVLKDQKLLDIQGLTVTVPVLSIVSGRGSTMDNKTYKALKSEEYPHIIYTLQAMSSVENTDEGQVLLLNGVVNIAGVDQTIDLEVSGKALGEGKMEFAASKVLDMTDFGIDPPTALFGTLKTGKEITINFKVILAPVNAVE